MTYPLEIELDDLLEDSLDAILGEIEEAAENIRKYRPERVSHTVDVDIHELLAEHQTIALIWDVDMLLSHYPHLSRVQAWEVLQECERNYKAENGLSWDDIAEAVTELFPDPAERLKERVTRFGLAVARYNDAWPEKDNLTDLLTDARHWCDAQNLDFSQLNGVAYDHYLNERNNKED